jgi:hypothetical protein
MADPVPKVLLMFSQKCLKTINPNPDFNLILAFIFFTIFIMVFKLHLQNFSSLVHLSALLKTPHFPPTSNQHFIPLHAIMHRITKLLNISLDKHLLSFHIIVSMTISVLATVYIILAAVLFSKKYKYVFNV